MTAVKASGDPDNLVIEDRPEPEGEAKQVLVRIRALERLARSPGIRGTAAEVYPVRERGAAMTFQQFGPEKMPNIVPVGGPPLLFTGAYDLANVGYRADEFFISGEATSYASPTPLQSDGCWHVEVEGRAAYTTRIVVLKPEKPSDFGGSVVVEWLNVSSGMDAPAEWLMTHREMVRSGYAYVAVSAQKVGISGGASLGSDMSLKTLNAERYGVLDHPGDAFSFDIFSQIGRLLRDQGSAAVLLGSLRPACVLAAGESQSAHFLTTYVNAIDPVARAYDGFFIHSRFAGSAPLDGRSIMSGTLDDMPQIVTFRPDLRVPVMTIITETDLVGPARSGYHSARQADSDDLRVWEIPGSAHADNYMLQVGAIDTGAAPIDEIVNAYAPTKDLMGTKLEKALNFAPQHHYVAEAALSQLDEWVRTGKWPPVARPIQLNEDQPPGLVLDRHRMACGGVRTPWIDVPTAWTSGLGDPSSIMAALFGAGEPFDKAALARLYPEGQAEYITAFEKSLNNAIHGGFVLEADRKEILELAVKQFPMD